MLHGEVAGVFDASSGAGSHERTVAGALAAEPPPDVVVEGPITLGWRASGSEVACGQGRCFCFLIGSVENAVHIAVELDLAQDAPLDLIVAAAYARWGSGMPARFEGRFAIVAWDGAAGDGLLAVDRLGVHSLFTHEAGGRLAFASEIRTLLRLLPRRPPPDRRAVVNWIATGFLERGQTLLAGVGRLGGGHVLPLGRSRGPSRPYWLPRYAPVFQFTRAEAAERLRDAVVGAVGRRRSERGTSGVLLSGGLDSTSVAAAARLVEDPGEGLRAYSVVFPEHPSMDEAELIERVTSDLDLPARRLAFRRGSMLAPSLEYLEAWQVPTVSPNLVFHGPLLSLASEDGVEVLLDGQGGDELFACSPYLLADRLRAGRLPSLLALVRRFPEIGAHPSRHAIRRVLGEFALKGAAPHVLHKAARRLRADEHYAPSWFTPESARLLTEARDPWEWKRISAPRWWAYLADEVTYQRERMGAHDFLRHKFALAGLRGGHPFLDDFALIDFVLRLLPELAFDPELDRPLLRASMAGLLPDEVRLRRDKSYFSALFVDSLGGADSAALTQLLLATGAEIHAFVRPGVVRERLLEAPAAHRHGAWAWAVWRLATVECWLRSQEDSGFPRRALAAWQLEPARYEVVTART